MVAVYQKKVIKYLPSTNHTVLKGASEGFYHVNSL